VVGSLEGSATACDKAMFMDFFFFFMLSDVVLAYLKIINNSKAGGELKISVT